jgi:hypothetical protein
MTLPPELATALALLLAALAGWLGPFIAVSLAGLLVAYQLAEVGGPRLRGAARVLTLAIVPLFILFVTASAHRLSSLL